MNCSFRVILLNPSSLEWLENPSEIGSSAYETECSLLSCYSLTLFSSLIKIGSRAGRQSLFMENSKTDGEVMIRKNRPFPATDPLTDKKQLRNWSHEWNLVWGWTDCPEVTNYIMVGICLLLGQLLNRSSSTFYYRCLFFFPCHLHLLGRASGISDWNSEWTLFLLESGWYPDCNWIRWHHQCAEPWEMSRPLDSTLESEPSKPWRGTEVHVLCMTHASNAWRLLLCEASCEVFTSYSEFVLSQELFGFGMRGGVGWGCGARMK